MFSDYEPSDDLSETVTYILSIHLTPVYFSGSLNQKATHSQTSKTRTLIQTAIDHHIENLNERVNGGIVLQSARKWHLTDFMRIQNECNDYDKISKRVEFVGIVN